jgi:hypothetical protein
MTDPTITVACLDPDRPPNDVPRHRWRQFVEDCKKFLSPSENWAKRAARLGWDAMALFGCAPKRPLDYSGLLWAINGGRLIELHRDWAVIDRKRSSAPTGCPSAASARQSAPCTSNHVERIERRGRRDALNLWPRSLASHPPDALRAPGASRAVSAAPSRSF